MYLYPRLLHSEADGRAREVASLSLEAARARSDVHDPRTVYSATGGTRVPASHLAAVRATLRQIADENGYPAALNRTRQQRFDAEAAAALKNEMGISASEGTRTGVWAFMACVLLPEIVRWRFPGGRDGTTLERFTGGSRGIRNTFGRLWWRAHLLGRDGDFSLLYELGEDELVQITERPVLSGNPYVAQMFARKFVDCASALEDVSRSDLMRDAIKRLRRLMAFVSLDVLVANQLRSVVEESLKGASTSLGVTAEEWREAGSSEPEEPKTSPFSGVSVVEGQSRENRGHGRLAKLIDRLQSLGLEVVDKRATGGCLWVVDKDGVGGLIERLQERGYPFTLAKSGSRSTDGRRAWYLPADFEADGARAGGGGAEAEQPSDGDELESQEPTADLDAWERGEVDVGNIAPAYKVTVIRGKVTISPYHGDFAPVAWQLSDTNAALRSRLRFLASRGPDGRSLAIVAATMAHQIEFLQQGIAHLRGLTLEDVAGYLGTHASTVSRSKDGVFLRTPSGILPLAFFFSEGVSDGSGPGLSGRAARYRLKILLESERASDPWTDEEIASRLSKLGVDIARRTVAKYRRILGIPNAQERRRDSGED